MTLAPRMLAPRLLTTALAVSLAIGCGAPHRRTVQSSAQDRGLLVPSLDQAGDERARVFTVVVEAGSITSVDSENRAGFGFGSITTCSAVVRRCVTG